MDFLKKHLIFGLFLLTTLGYFILTLITPIKESIAEQYEVSVSALRIINISIIFPVLAIYFISYYGYHTLKEYEAKINGHDDGRAFRLIVRGIAWLTFTLPARSLISATYDYLGKSNSALIDDKVIIINLVTVVFSLLAFLDISDGADMLVKSIKKLTRSDKQNYWVLASIVGSSLFTFLILRREDDGQSAYFLPDIVIIFLIAIPYIFAWYRGLRAALDIRMYRSAVQGTLYKDGLKFLSFGIIGAVMCSILIQVFIAVSAQLNRLDIQPVLLMVYALLVFLGVSFAYIAKGSKKLQKIEDA